ncbi:hypothetical protein BRADI_1g36185v3 [Brachypodium distachyon]|uniref:Uncharacterized protein n=1 Tax=Brachypodium distachyon TaxID=15368 RepID=A0A2K2DMY8_BRADI|nr:hypothetical protein BRADI_1g36185v3 [Brachypodium distachyon]
MQLTSRLTASPRLGCVFLAVGITAAAAAAMPCPVSLSPRLWECRRRAILHQGRSGKPPTPRSPSLRCGRCRLPPPRPSSAPTPSGRRSLLHPTALLYPASARLAPGRRDLLPFSAAAAASHHRGHPLRRHPVAADASSTPRPSSVRLAARPPPPRSPPTIRACRRRHATRRLPTLPPPLRGPPLTRLPPSPPRPCLCPPRPFASRRRRSPPAIHGRRQSLPGPQFRDTVKSTQAKVDLNEVQMCCFNFVQLKFVCVTSDSCSRGFPVKMHLKLQFCVCIIKLAFVIR